jgi:hypothetical protein
MLTASFFQAQHDFKEDISMHVAKLQKRFVDLNDELAKHGENTLSGHMLTEKILSAKEYDNFKDVWDTISANTHTVNLLIEKLCAIELRADTSASAEATGLVAHENDRRKSNSMKVNNSNSIKKELTAQNRSFHATSANNLVTGLWSVLKSSSMKGTEVANWLQRRKLMHSRHM